MKKITAIALSSCVAVSLIVTPQSAHGAPYTETVTVKKPTKVVKTTTTTTVKPDSKKEDSQSKKTRKSDYSSDKLRLVNGTNSYRLSKGKSTLSNSKDLERAAQKHAEYLARTGKFKHDTNPDPLGKGYSGENIFMTTGDPYRALEGWKKSPDHNENLLDNRFEKIGIGIANSKVDDSIIVVQKFHGEWPEWAR